MEENYIVAFRSGSSGRLIANIIWALIKEDMFDYVLTDYNSTHNFSPYTGSFDLSNVPKSNRMYSDPNIYKYFEFNESPGVIPLHAYPDFDTIENRYPNTKVVIISYTASDIPEITGNCLLKNGFETLSNNGPANNSTSFILSRYKLLFNKEYTGSITPEEKRQLFLAYELHIKRELLTSPFKNHQDSANENVLVINYRDLCDNMTATLSKITKFTKTTMKDGVEKLYYNYLIGREKLIQSQMPWLL